MSMYIRKQTQQYAMGREGGREEKEDREGEGGREGRIIEYKQDTRRQYIIEYINTAHGNLE